LFVPSLMNYHSFYPIITLDILPINLYTLYFYWVENFQLILPLIVSQGYVKKKWRCLNDKEAPWRDLLNFRYGSFADNFFVWGREGES
jgi:hypothetical protein